MRESEYQAASPGDDSDQRKQSEHGAQKKQQRGEHNSRQDHCQYLRFLGFRLSGLPQNPQSSDQ